MEGISWGKWQRKKSAGVDVSSFCFGIVFDSFGAGHPVDKEDDAERKPF